MSTIAFQYSLSRQRGRGAGSSCGVWKTGWDLESIELEIAKKERIQLGRCLRSELNRLSDSVAVGMLRTALRAGNAGQNGCIEFGQPVTREVKGGVRAAQLVLTPEGFFVAQRDVSSHAYYLSKDPADRGPVTLSWKWLSLMSEVVRGGVTLEVVKSTLKDEAMKLGIYGTSLYERDRKGALVEKGTCVF